MGWENSLIDYYIEPLPPPHEQPALNDYQTESSSRTVSSTAAAGNDPSPPEESTYPREEGDDTPPVKRKKTENGAGPSAPTGT